MIVSIIVIGVVLALLYVVNTLLSPAKISLSDGHIVITGGSSGIGRSLGIEAAKRGSNVTIIARKKDVLQEATAAIEKHFKDPTKQKVLAISLDLTGDCDVIEREIQKAEDSLGPVDVLVNCAGFSICDSFENISMEEFRRLMEVNYIAAVSATKAVVGGMKTRRRGRIVFVSSQAGQVGVYGMTGYSAAKFALRGLAEALQSEVKPYNVYVTVSFPPDTDTPGYKEEMIRKPKETALISDTSGLFEAETVAKIILRDILQGRFLSTVGLDGFMVGNLTCGMSPVSNVKDTLVQIFMMSIFRLVSIFYLTSFDNIVKKCHDEKKNKQQ